MRSEILKLFSDEKIQLQYSGLDYRTDLHFFEHNLVVEVDGKGRTDRDEKKENIREEKVK